MKLLAVVTLVALIGCIQGATEEEKKHVEECSKQSAVEKAPLEKVEKGIVEDDPKLAEFLFCFYKKQGILNDADEYVPEVMRAEIAKELNGTLADTIVENCTKEKYSSGLETSVELTKCYYKYAPKKE